MCCPLDLYRQEWSKHHPHAPTNAFARVLEVNSRTEARIVTVEKERPLCRHNSDARAPVWRAANVCNAAIYQFHSLNP